MTDTPDDLLLLEAEHLARDLLVDADETRRDVAGLLNGWAPMIQAASDYFAPHSVTPFSQLVEIGRVVRRDASDWLGKGTHDPRLTRIRDLFEDLGGAPELTRQDPTRRKAVLQTSYLATHAVAGALSRYAQTLTMNESSRAHGQLVAALSARIHSGEHILDAQLSVLPMGTRAADLAHGFATATAAWDRALHDALVDKTPDPRVLLVSANVSIGLLRRTAALASTAAADGHIDAFTVHYRLLPTLGPAIETWERTRDTWRALAPATTGMPHPVAAAAHALHRALNALPTDSPPETALAARLAIMATMEAAHLQVAATRRSDLKGMASGVSALTQHVFEHVPGVRSLDLWRQLERLDGPASISIPSQVRTELMHHAIETLEAAALTASASHGLIDGAVRKAQPQREVTPAITRARPRGGIDRRL